MLLKLNNLFVKLKGRRVTHTILLDNKFSFPLNFSVFCTSNLVLYGRNATEVTNIKLNDDTHSFECRKINSIHMQLLTVKFHNASTHPQQV